jgi:hypothetical protein
LVKSLVLAKNLLFWCKINGFNKNPVAMKKSQLLSKMVSCFERKQLCGAALIELGAALIELGAALIELGPALIELGPALIELGPALIELGAALIELGPLTDFLFIV